MRSDDMLIHGAKLHLGMIELDQVVVASGWHQ